MRIKILENLFSANYKVYEADNRRIFLTHLHGYTQCKLIFLSKNRIETLVYIV